MRICIFCQEDLVRPQGGTGTYARNVGLALAARGHDVHAIVRRRDDAPASERFAGVHIHRVDAPGPTVLYSPLYFRAARIRFLALNHERPFDVVLGNMPLMSSWGMPAGAAPEVETVHCTVAEELRAIGGTPLRRLNPNEVLTRALAPVLRAREGRLLGRTSAVITVSRGLRRELVEQRGYPADRISVIPNGIDYAHFAGPVAGLPELRRRHGLTADAEIILYLGRLVERKRAIDLVAAMPEVLRRRPRARLLIVGRRTPNAARATALARQLGVERQVSLVDHVAYAEVPAFYRMAAVYALPSAYEGFPFTVLEAMAAGTPVVATAIPGVDEQVVHGENGLLYPVGDVAALAERLVDTLSDRPAALARVERARRMVAERYTWEVVGAQTERVLLAAAHAAPALA